MPSNIRPLSPPLWLNERVLRPVQHLARMAGVSPEEIIEFLLEEIFEGDVAPAPRPPAAVISIFRKRTWPIKEVDLSALRHSAEKARCQAQEARSHAAAACHAAGSAREYAARFVTTRGR